MNFNSNIQIVKGGEIPNNSVALLYSPTCGYCHQMIPQYNELPNALRAGGLSDVQVVAVDIQQEFHSLRAGGIQVMGVPHVIIKTVQGGLIDYNGPRMADSIAQEAARVLNGGETKLLNGGAQEDALLGGSTPVVDATATTPAVTGGATDLEGGKKRRRKSKSRSRSRKHRKMHGGEQVQGGEADLEGGKKRRRKSKSRSRSRKHRKMHGGETAEVKVEGGSTTETTEAAVAVTGGSTDLEGGKKRRRKSKSRSRSRKHRKMHGGEQVQGGEADLEGGKKRRRKSKSRSRSRKHRKMHGGETEVKVEGGAVAVEGGATTETAPAEVVAVTGGSTDLEGGKKRRRKSKSRSRSRKHRKMHGGDAEVKVEGGEADLEGGKKRRRKSKSRSRSRRHHKMHGGETQAPVQGGEDAAAIEGGKRRRKSRSKSRSKSRWMATVMKLYNTGKYKTLGAAMKSAKRIYRG
jgi:thiol-disulfide isomerase/thioredoxin/predicted outer membrane protein